MCQFFVNIPVYARRAHSGIMFVCKLFKGFISSAYLLECFSIHVVPARSTRGAPVTLFSVPSASSRWSRVNTVVNGLFVRGRRLLSDLMKSSPTCDIFHDTLGSDQAPCHHVYIFTSRCSLSVKTYMYISLDLMCACEAMKFGISKGAGTINIYTDTYMVYMRLWMCFYLTTSPVIGYLPVWWYNKDTRYKIHTRYKIDSVNCMRGVSTYTTSRIWHNCSDSLSFNRNTPNRKLVSKTCSKH